MAQLFVLSGPDVGKSFEVASGDTIGRSPECIITVRHASVSRNHAHLEREGGTWYVVDDGSRNGVLVDGARQPRAALSDMAEFSLGELLLRFRDEAPAPEEPAPTPAPPTARAPAPAPAEEEDEIQLEDPDDIEVAPPAAPDPSQLARTTFSAGSSASAAPAADTGFGRSAAPAGASVHRGRAGAGDRILQYSKVGGGGGGFSGTDLSQYPFWVRAGIGLLGLALAVGLAWLAFHGTSFVKKQVSGDAPMGELGEDG